MNLIDNIKNLNSQIEHYSQLDVMSGCVEERLNKSFESYFEMINETYNNAMTLSNTKLLNEIKKVK